MRFVSVDIETTGLDFDKCQILEVGLAVFESTSQKNEAIDSSYKVIKYDGYYWEPGAFDLHRLRFDYFLGVGDNRVRVSEVWPWLAGYFERYKTKIAVGKNFGSFDFQFIRRLPGFKNGVIGHRSIDIGTLALSADDTEIPAIAEALRRLNVKYDPSQAHIALYDATVTGQAAWNFFNRSYNL